MRLEAEAKNSSEKERMREVKGAEMRSVWGGGGFQQSFRALSVRGVVGCGNGRRESDRCKLCQRCCLFGPGGWNRWRWTGCLESFPGIVLGSPFYEWLKI